MLTREDTALSQGTGEQAFHGPGAPSGTITDFWRWAYSDLMSNTTRGVFAEWLVARLIGIPSSQQRVEWGAYDLVTPEGVKIEVKSGAYKQSWHTDHPVSKIIFSGLRAKIWKDRVGHSLTPSFNSDLYVFCVETETDRVRWDAFDLSQWRFYFLRKADMERLNQDSVGLATLRRLADEMDAPAFRERMLQEIAELSWAGDLKKPIA